jgi:predicted GIY-YIG superfamily endonuclease
MPSYLNGQVYQLIFGDLTDRYIGSTTQPLRKRLYQHKSKYVSRAVRDLIEQVGIKNVTIRLIETYPCSSKDALLSREQYWIDILQSDANVNRALSKKKYSKYLVLRFPEWRKSIMSPHENPSHAERDEYKSIIIGEDYTTKCKQHNKRWNDHGCVEIDDTGEIKYWCRNYKTCPRNPANI